MTDEHRIPISILSDYTVEGIHRTLHDCYSVHVWTLNRLKERFLETLAIPANREISLSLTRYSEQAGLGKFTQRFTLNRAMEKTADEFRRELKVDGERIDFPSPSLESNYNEFDIKARKIWQRYLEQYGGISTVYGMLLLEGDWKYLLLEQAREINVTPSYLPLLWHSVTIKREEEGYNLKFNLHDPTSIQGKRAKKKLKVEKL